MPSHLFIAGFSGSGKSTVGEIVARRLGWGFLDLDRQIEKSCGESVAVLFSEKGESYFRRMETRELLRVTKACSKPLVVSLGGGALLNKTNRALISRHGTSVYLRCSQKELFRRLTSSTPRPLLKSSAKSKTASRQIINQLFKSRRQQYEQCDIMLSVTNLNPQQAAKQICEAIS